MHRPMDLCLRSLDFSLSVIIFKKSGFGRGAERSALSEASGQAATLSSQKNKNQYTSTVACIYPTWQFPFEAITKLNHT